MGLLKYAAGSAAVVALACCHSTAYAQSNSDQLPPVVVNPNDPPKPARQIRRDRDRRRASPVRPAANSPRPIPPQPAEVVVTADREPEPISRTGSSISVVKGETLATSNPGSLVDALRTVPGLDISESGGPGSTTNIRLRGANTGQTLVMIDGIRINDPTAASGDFDFAMFAPSAIERIEVLKGPQSALYGSDAMGGVVNIITKKGSGPAQFNVRTEGGSYGTAVTNGSVTDSPGPWSYAVTGGGQHSNGFSRFGYRIPPLEAKYGPLERDGFDRVGGSARFGYDAGEGVRLEAGTLSSFTRSAYDQSTGTFPDTPSSATRQLDQVWGRASVDTFGGILDPQPQRIRHAYRSLLQRCDLQDQYAAAEYDVDRFRLRRQQHWRRISGQFETRTRSAPSSLAPRPSMRPPTPTRPTCCRNQAQQSR